ncbi:MAG: energy-coupling factor ABC transporter ATP-binding protein [Actinobacteria bacterium]|nr:energy-coupling factor ABC transporter ATP-binding protein [Actinomycetota bacterium]
MIELLDVSFGYKHENVFQPIIKNINFQIKSGDKIALIGHNGSGKTTLIRLCLGLLSPTSGRVLVDGLDLSDRRDLQSARKKLGIIFQDSYMHYFGSTVQEDVAFGPSNYYHDSGKIKELVDSAINIVGIESLRMRNPLELSGGQGELASIAAALASKPRYLFMDEPAVMLDVLNKEMLLSRLFNICEDLENSIIYVTHNLEEISRFDRLLVLCEGELTFDGKPGAFISSPELWAKNRLEMSSKFRLLNLIRQKLRSVNAMSSDLKIDDDPKDYCRLYCDIFGNEPESLLL